MKTLKLLTIGFLVFGATILAAETLPTRGPLPFSTYDNDNNNVITLQEFNIIKKQRLNQKFQSGYLSRNSVVFSDIDVNADGKITPTELKTHQDNRYYNRGYQQNRFSNGINQQNINMNNRGMGMRQGRGYYGGQQYRGNYCMCQCCGNNRMGQGRGNW